MADFIIVGGKARKSKGRFGGESGGRNYDRSYERRHLKLTSNQLIAAAFEDLHTYDPMKTQKPVSKPEVEVRVASHPRPRPVLSHPSAVYHNNRKVTVYAGGMRIVSASY